jgi:hypothetical protein
MRFGFKHCHLGTIECFSVNQIAHDLFGDQLPIHHNQVRRHSRSSVSQFFRAMSRVSLLINARAFGKAAHPISKPIRNSGGPAKPV